MHLLISPFQNAFIKGRSITNNMIILAHELYETFTHTQRKKKEMQENSTLLQDRYKQGI